MPLFQACPDQKLNLSRSETVQIRVVHCTIYFDDINTFFHVDLSGKVRCVTNWEILCQTLCQASLRGGCVEIGGETDNI